MHTGERWRLGHRPALDGLRGVAILLVLAAHARITWLHGGGQTGVALFFALSGFLITSLLLDEWETSGTISLRAFYARRARRLGPALVTSTAAIAAVGLWLGWSAFFNSGHLLPVLAYYGNWHMVSGGYLGALSSTWSLAVEEQFYLVWPLVVLVTLRRFGTRSLWVVAWATLVASLTVRGWLFVRGDDMSTSYYRTDVAAFALAAGVLLALAARRGWSPSAPVWIGAVLLVAGSLLDGTMARYMSPLLAVGAAGLLIPHGLRAGGMMVAPWLRWFGSRSYGIYLWQGPLVWVPAVALEAPMWVVLGVCIPVTLVVAEVSWRLVERPFLARRTTVPASGDTRDAAEHFVRSDARTRPPR